jgi:integrase
LIELSGEVKNAWSERIIPVCSEVVEALRRARAAVVQSVDGRVIPFETSYYSKSMLLQFRTWNEGMGWQCKDLRNCLLQFARSEGLLNGVWEEYCGHSPKGVTEKHYVARLSTVSRGEDQALKKAMALFRNQVVTHLETAIKGQTVQDRPTLESETM